MVGCVFWVVARLFCVIAKTPQLLECAGLFGKIDWLFLRHQLSSCYCNNGVAWDSWMVDKVLQCSGKDDQGGC